jgi:flagellar motility protein MotE (MotC chaperone)
MRLLVATVSLAALAALVEPAPAAEMPRWTTRIEAEGRYGAVASPRSHALPLMEIATTSRGLAGETVPPPKGANDPLTLEYCKQLVVPAFDARSAWQKRMIDEAEQQLQQQIKRLEKQAEELKSWQSRRDEFVSRVDERLVGIYTRMRPDAAALQLKAMDDETAAALVAKLDSKRASAILNDMDADHAARLAVILASAARLPAKRSRSDGTK